MPVAPGAPTVAERLAAFAGGLTLAQVPDAVLERARVAVLHNLTVALAGQALAGVPLALARELGRGADGPAARLLVGGERVDLRSAAFANSLLVTARAQDDIHFPAFSHVGCIVLPAALAVAEDRDVSGAALMTALVAGYEVTAAIGADGRAARSAARGFRPVLYSQVGAAVACGLLLGATEAQLAHAIGLAVSFGAGTSQTWHAGTQEWLYQSAVAAQNGLVAALLAVRGVTGAPDALEGVAGLYATFGGDAGGAGAVGAELGDRWRLPELTFKPYPVCTLNQVPVTALVALAAEHGVRVEAVERVTVTMVPAEARYPGTDRRAPFADFGAAMMSVRFCLAAALREGTVTPERLLAVDDPATLALAERIDLEEDPALAPRSCRLAVRLHDGSVHEAAFESGPETFAWDRDEALRRARALQPQTPLDATAFEAFATTALDADRQPARALVDAAVGA